MNLFTRYKNIRFLKKCLKGSAEVNRQGFNNIVKIGFNTYKDFKKGSRERNLLVTVIKKYRDKFPYIVQGYAEDKKIYDEYFTLKNHIEKYEDLKEGDYLYKFRTDNPVKVGYKYYTNSYGLPSEQPYVVKLGSKKRYGFTIDSYHSVNEENITMYLYATEDQIKEYEKKSAEKIKLEKQIKEKQKEVQKLYSKISRL